MKNHYKTKKNLLLLLGICIFSFIIYSRLLRHREPRFLFQNIDLIRLCLNFSLFFISFVACIIYLKKLYTYFAGSRPQSRIMKWILRFFYNPKNPLLYWNESLIQLDAFMKNSLPLYDNHSNYSEMFIEKIGLFLLKYRKSSQFILLLIIILCQSIVCVSFLIDVFINEQFYYFYRYLGIIIVPMIINYIIYSIKMSVETNLESLDAVLDLVLITDQDANGFLQTYTIDITQWYYLRKHDNNSFICHNSLKESYIKTRPLLDQSETLNYCIHTLNTFLDFKLYNEEYEKYSFFMLTPFNILKFSLYASGWGFICFIISW